MQTFKQVLYDRVVAVQVCCLIAHLKQFREDDIIETERREFQVEIVCGKLVGSCLQVDKLDRICLLIAINNTGRLKSTQTTMPYHFRPQQVCLSIVFMTGSFLFFYVKLEQHIHYFLLQTSLIYEVIIF